MDDKQVREFFQKLDDEPAAQDDMIATCECGKQFHCSLEIWTRAQAGELDMPMCSECEWIDASRPNR